jgi:hypothetical protein
LIVLSVGAHFAIECNAVVGLRAPAGQGERAAPIINRAIETARAQQVEKPGIPAQLD